MAACAGGPLGAWAHWCPGVGPWFCRKTVVNVFAVLMLLLPTSSGYRTLPPPDPVPQPRALLLSSTERCTTQPWDLAPASGLYYGGIPNEQWKCTFIDSQHTGFDSCTISCSAGSAPTYPSTSLTVTCNGGRWTEDYSDRFKCLPVCPAKPPEVGLLHARLQWNCNPSLTACNASCPAGTRRHSRSVNPDDLTLNCSKGGVWKHEEMGSISTALNCKAVQDEGPLIGGITGGLGGTALLAACAVFAWFRCKPGIFAWFRSKPGAGGCWKQGGAPVATAEAKYSVGVDMGAACSGYAFVKLGDSTADVVQVWEYSDADKNTQGSSVADIKLPKTMTAILYRKHPLRGWRPMDWGRHAFMAYQKLPLSQRQDYQLFEDFKIALANEDEHRRFMLQMRPDCNLTLENVIADFLHFIKGHALKKLGEHYHDSSVAATDVTWTLTVPANWTPGAQETMKQAAAKAGMVTTGDDAKLYMVTEPEAAAQSCLHRKVVQHTTPGATFMVVDAGGATTDITVHQVYEDGQLEEPLFAAGIMAGSKHIDRNFETWLSGQLGEAAFHKWKQDNPVAYLKLMHGDWDHAKCEYGLDDVGSTCIFSFDDNQLWAQMPERTKSELSARGILSGGRTNAIILKQTDLGLFFKDVVADIAQLVKKSVHDAGRVPEKMLLVGGLGSSPHLVREMQALSAREGWATEVVTPLSGLAAVVEGAALTPKEEGEGLHVVATFGYGMWLPRSNLSGKVDASTATDQSMPAWHPIISVGEHLQTQMKQKQFAATSAVTGPVGSTATFKIYRTTTREPVYGTKSQGEDIGTLLVDLAVGQGAPGILAALAQPRVEFSYRLGRSQVIVLAKTKKGCCGSLAFPFQ